MARHVYLSDAFIGRSGFKCLEKGVLVKDVQVCVHKICAQRQAPILQSSQGHPDLPPCFRRAASNERQLLLLSV